MENKNLNGWTCICTEAESISEGIIMNKINESQWLADLFNGF